MKQFIDLHIHTDKSDGSDSVCEVIQLAQSNNVSVISITDHNTMDAYTEETMRQARSAGVQLIPGVELDVIYNGKQFHLLGFGIDVHNSKMREVCAHNLTVQEAYNLDLLRCMEKDGIGVSEKDYMEYQIPKSRGGWKLLNYLLDIGLTKSLLEGTKYYKQYGFNSNTIKFVSLEEAVKVIKEAGGVSVLAHPAEQIVYNQYESQHDAFWTSLNELLQTKIEGIECIHPLHGFGLQRDLINFCNENGLFASGGTDYHGHFFNKQKQTIGGQLIGAEIAGKLIKNVVHV